MRSHEDNLILRLEVMKISKHRIARACDFFYDFIKKNETTTDYDKQVIVACAIRKILWYINTKKYTKVKVSDLLKLPLEASLKLQITTSCIDAYTAHKLDFDWDPELEAVLLELFAQYGKNARIETQYERALAKNLYLLLHFWGKASDKLLKDTTATWFLKLIETRIKMITKDRNTHHERLKEDILTIRDGKLHIKPGAERVAEHVRDGAG